MFFFHFWEISAKMCQSLLVWFGRPILETFLVISWDSVHIFQNWFLRWNCESEPVDLNTMNPTIRTTFFFTYKGVRAILLAILDKLPMLRFRFFFCFFFTSIQLQIYLSVRDLFSKNLNWWHALLYTCIQTHKKNILSGNRNVCKIVCGHFIQKIL